MTDLEKLLSRNPEDIRQYSPLTLAFIGDGVFDLLVREYFVTIANAPAGVLNQNKVKLVCCRAQSQMAQALKPHLTDDETDVFKRGRNAHVHAPKNQSLADYHAATGLESLFGYLYLCGKTERMEKLFEIIINEYKNTVV